MSSTPLAARAGVVRESVIRQVLAIESQLRRRGVDFIRLSAGQPGLPPDPRVLNFLAQLLKEKPAQATSYTPTSGILELLEAIASDLERYGGFTLDPLQEITITEGGAEATFLLALALVNPGDEVVLFDPTFPPSVGAFQLMDAKVKFLPVSVEDGYQPSLEKLQEVVSRNTKAVLIITPDNPTGRILNRDFLKGLGELAEDYGFWIISDEAYKHIIYQEVHHWVYKEAGVPDQTLVINSFSKDPGMPGFRIGYIYGPREIISQVRKLKQFVTLTPSSIAQYAALYYLTSGVKEEYLRYSLEIYRKRRDAFYRAFKKAVPEAKTLFPQASFYFFVDLQHYLANLNMDDIAFAEELLKEQRVSLIPGSPFGRQGIRHVRITFVTEPEERLEEAAERIAEFFKRRGVL
ncbi:MAG: pyridoxal phosphate-dependent aminotransferase [Candidatus Verstraetearchaeota archaeon]|nr:pyridoxal phosphate-dependent aminotransferase [Candidatus Verstraetearchaeota archaeon]